MSEYLVIKEEKDREIAREREKKHIYLSNWLNEYNSDPILICNFLFTQLEKFFFPAYCLIVVLIIIKNNNKNEKNKTKQRVSKTRLQKKKYQHQHQKYDFFSLYRYEYI